MSAATGKGRPRAPASIRARAARLSADSLESVATIARNATNTPADRIEAARLLVDTALSTDGYYRVPGNSGLSIVLSLAELYRSGHLVIADTAPQPARAFIETLFGEAVKLLPTHAQEQA